MFLGKLAYGVALSFVILAGTVRMPLKKFFGWGALVAILQFWSLLLLGYFFGSTFSSSTTHLIENLLNALAGILLLASVYFVFSLYMRSKWRKETGEK